MHFFFSIYPHYQKENKRSTNTMQKYTLTLPTFPKWERKAHIFNAKFRCTRLFLYFCTVRTKTRFLRNADNPQKIYTIII